MTHDGIEVDQFTTRYSSGKVDGYYEYRNYPSSPYRYYNEYNTSRNIVQSSTTFYRVRIGMWKYYDSSGNIIREVNQDAEFLFTVTMFIDKMEKEYDIDFLNKSEKSVSRYPLSKLEYLGIPTYKVDCEVVTSVERYRNGYLIDDNTGKTLYTRKRPLEEDYFFSFLFFSFS